MEFIKYIWDNPELLNSFSLYCLKEFAIESVLFLIEANEYNIALLKTNQNIIQNTIPNRRFKLQKYIPKSAIINCIDTNKYDGKLHGFVRLFIKYCLLNSKFCINVSSKSRNTLCDLFGIDMYWDANTKNGEELLLNKFKNNNTNFDSAKWHIIFDDCIKEITKLIESKYKKFIKTKAHDKFMRILFHKH